MDKLTPNLHWRAFLIAFLSAPILVTLLTFWAYLIPFYALLIGGPVYVVVGLPVLIWFLKRYPPNYMPIILMALLSQALLIPLILIAAWFMDDWDIVEAIPFFINMGAVFALLWSATFVFLYRRLIDFN